MFDLISFAADRQRWRAAQEAYEAAVEAFEVLPLTGLSVDDAGSSLPTTPNLACACAGSCRFVRA